MTTATEMLDLDILSRAESVRFDLTDKTGSVLGAIHPVSAVTISNNANAQIKRSLSGFVLPADEFTDVNPLSDRVRPYWVLSDGTEYPCGVLLFAEASTQRWSYGRTLTASLVDQGLILAQEISESLGFSAGTTASAAITRTFEAAGFYTASVATTAYTFGSPIAYPAGRGGATYAKILNEICQKAGYYPAYFDNDGTPIVRATETIADATATLKYLDGGRITSGTIVESNDLLKAPNRLLVVDTSATTGDVSYVYDIPEGAPHSFENRGFRITKTIEAPGVGDKVQAANVARAYYANNPQAYESAVWSSPADPRHDTFDVVNYRGVNYLEMAWSLKCAPGGSHTHTASRVYT